MKQLSIDIPMMIQYIFLMYYWIEEKFTICGRKLKLDGTNKCKSIPYLRDYYDKTYEYNTVYGNNVIDVNDTSIAEYKWTFKYKNLGTVCMYFGIDASQNKMINQEFCSKWDNNHAFFSIGTSGYATSYCDEDVVEYGQMDDKGILHLILDMKKKKLYFALNDEKHRHKINWIGFELREKKRFNMAVSIPMMSDQTVKLTAFNIKQK